MRTNIVLFFSLVVLFVFICFSEATSSELIHCTGKVVDSQGQPVSSAKASLYRFIVQEEILTFDVELVRTTTTKKDGLFTFEFDGQSGQLSFPTVILVEKEQMALGWANWYLGQDNDIQITLGRPSILAGKIIDESGEPVSDAEVGISVMVIKEGDEMRYLTGKVSEQFLLCKTDASGMFKFDNIPSEAAAEFVVKKNSFATVGTFDEKKSEGMKLQYKPGQENIEITLPLEAKIEGIVTEKESGRPVPGVKLIAFQQGHQPFSGNEPIISRKDGTFTIGALCPGQNIIRAMLSPEEAKDWVVGPVEVNLEAGRKSTAVKMELSKGGVVEIVVTELDENIPIEGAIAHIRSTMSKEGFSETTDKNGIIRKRLAPGQYQIMHIFKQNFPYEQQEKMFTIEDGKTNRITIQLKGYPKVSGTVRDEKGLPISGAIVSARPSFGEEAISDAKGAFSLILKSPSMMLSQSSEEVIYIIARHKERNLATAVQLDEKADNLEIELSPGIVFSGKVVDVNGAGMPDADISLTFWASDYGYGSQEPTQIDSDGNFEIRAIPAGYRYSVNASADGYGQRYVQVNTSEAESDRMELEPLVLNVANLSASGIVVDELDKPVPNIRVYAYGNGQQDRETYTDAEGKFTLENVCAGPIHIQATSREPKRFYGQAITEGGTTDIKIVVSERDSSGRPVPIQPPSLISKALSELEDFGLKFSPEDVNDRVILVCFFDMEQRPSRNCVMQLTKMVEQLKQKGVEVIAVQASKIDENKLNEWIKEQNISFPVGMIQDNVEQTRFNWGVKSLPWLILTNKEHVAIAEGFALSELDEKINQ
jgi:protocatechuate 3,4-dioxygenase beta subunit